MCVVRAFEILKERWRTIMRRSNKLLQHIIDVIAICIV